MEKTIAVTLDAELLESLTQITAQKGMSVENVFADMAQQFIDEARREKIHKEFEHYKALHAELKAKYLGQHVAVHEGQVVDHDADLSALIRRVRQRFGRIPIMFTQVGEQPTREFTTHSTRLV